ncbi:hypothetical protein RB195_010303 [Necator americanus]|uniref:Uncharacterized protein n=1 Tax=Necator americanus TaxID=51031 RepID=A0ABR1CZQ7_NECAM
MSINGYHSYVERLDPIHRSNPATYSAERDQTAVTNGAKAIEDTKTLMTKNWMSGDPNESHKKEESATRSKLHSRKDISIISEIFTANLGMMAIQYLYGTRLRVRLLQTLTN